MKRVKLILALIAYLTVIAGAISLALWLSTSESGRLYLHHTLKVNV